MKINSSYFDNKAAELAKRYDSISTEETHPSWLYLIELFNKKILDIGCGSGRDALYMAKSGGIVTAIDFSEKLLEIAKLKDDRVHWVKDSLPCLTKINDDSSFDFILASAVLMFLCEEDQIKSINKIISLLDKNGTFIFTIKIDEDDPNIYPLSKNVFNKLKGLNCSCEAVAGGADRLNRIGVNWDVYIVNKQH